MSTQPMQAWLERTVRPTVHAQQASKLVVVVVVVVVGQGGY